MCTADGAPPPTYMWMKESVPLAHSRNFDLSIDGILRIENVEASSGGNYTCRASNDVGGNEVGSAETSTVLTTIGNRMCVVICVSVCRVGVIITGNLTMQTAPVYGTANKSPNSPKGSTFII